MGATLEPLKLDCKVSVDSELPNRPPLNEAVRSASEYLKHLIAKYPEVNAEERSLTWKYDVVPGEEPGLTATLSEHDDYGFRRMASAIRESQILDPTNQRIFIQDLLRSVVNVRSQQIMKSRNRRLLNSDEGMANGEPG